MTPLDWEKLDMACQAEQSWCVKEICLDLPLCPWAISHHWLKSATVNVFGLEIWNCWCACFN